MGTILIYALKNRYFSYTTETGLLLHAKSAGTEIS